MKFEKYYEELKQLDVGTVLKDEPLYKHTTYRVGGPAKLFIKAQNVDELIEVIKYCRKHRINFLLLEEVQIYCFQIKVLKELLFPLKI